ncbi:MAG TPA: tetratricopeptide repeat protein [Steroidobacteraceae bacterium]|nr:tetratricopeptide repeat protein [Steroidobacteraceae bacterium]
MAKRLPWQPPALAAGLLACLLVGCGSPKEREARHLERGMRYLAANNLEKARVEFRNALQNMPTDAVARYENGVVEERLQRYVEAAGFYRTAIEADPGQVPARVALAKLTLLGGYPQQALEFIKPALVNHPEDAQLLVVRAACESALKDPAAALEDARHAVRLEPRNLDAVGVLAGLYQGSGDAQQARALLESTLRQIPDSVEVRLMLVHVYDSLNLNSQAEATLIEVTKLRPAESALRIQLAQYYTKMQQPDAAEAVLRDAIKAIPADPGLKGALIDFLAHTRGRDVAEREITRLIAAEPDNPALRFAAAQFYEQARDYVQAERQYREVIARSKFAAPTVVARDRLAALKLTQGDFAGARKLVEEVLAGEPRDADALILRGNITLAEGKDPKAAIADLRIVLRDQPNALGVMRSLARAHVANGEPDLAAEILRRGVEANPKDPGVRLDLAQLMAETDGAVQAKPLIDQLAREQPRNPQVLDTQFKIAIATADMATARSAADALVALQPNSSTGYVYQGMLAEAGERPEEAAKLYAAALEREPDAAEPLHRLARVLVELKRLPEAVATLDAAIQRYPQGAEAALIEGDVYLGVQRPRDAAGAFRIVIARDPKSAVGYGRLATAQLAAGDVSGAIATLNDGIVRSGDPDPLRISLAALYETRGRTDEAARIYEDMLQRNPNADVAANNLAMLLVNNRSDAASLDRAAQLAARFSQSTDPNFLDTYGWVLYKRGYAAAAVVALRGVVARAPEAPLGLYHLGMAQVLAGQADGARDNLAHALRSGKTFPGMDDARMALARLGGRSAASSTAPKS